MTPPPIVYAQGERVYLRPLMLSDHPFALSWLNDPQTRPFLARILPLTETEERRYIEEQSADRHRVSLTICENEDDEPIGFTGLHSIEWVARQATFGIVIGRVDRRGQGLGGEATGLILDVAFKTLNLHRVTLVVHATNRRAIRCYEQLGFQAEGVAREAHFANGEYVDELHYGLLDREWLGRKSES